jgi:hypothetical protein
MNNKDYEQFIRIAAEIIREALAKGETSEKNKEEGKGA